MPQQPDLFGSDPPPSAAGQAVVLIAGAAAKLSKAQREFNRLSERIARLREHLAQWRLADDTSRQRAATELVPLQTRLADLQRDTVLWADAYLAHPPQGERLPKKLRAKLVAMLRLLAQAVLAIRPDEAAEAAHDRHSAQSHRESQRAQADLAASVLGQVMGDPSLFEGEADSLDDLMQRASQRLQDQAVPDWVDEPAPPPPGHRPSREDKARARDAQALKEASQSVREVYRRLASSLHPDREPDEAERARKTTLMARVNEAYARNDLLALLTVQLDIEQITAAHLAGVPDQRLRHYSHVLKEQQQALEEELALLQMPVCEHMAADPGLLNWSPKLLAQVLADDLAGVRSAIRALSEDTQALRDSRTRLAFLRALQVDDPDEEPDPFEQMLMMQTVDELLGGVLGDPSANPAAKRRRRNKR